MLHALPNAVIQHFPRHQAIRNEAVRLHDTVAGPAVPIGYAASGEASIGGFAAGEANGLFRGKPTFGSAS
jgi:hypothetical protein